MVRVEEYLTARGHPNVTASHRTTFEITKEEELSLSGHCIIAVGADKGAGDLDRRFCEAVQVPGSTLITILTCGPCTLEVHSKGDPGLIFTHPTDLVWRRSSFTCDRTIGVFADHTARDIPREMVSLLQQGEELTVRLIALNGE